MGKERSIRNMYALTGTHKQTPECHFSSKKVMQNAMPTTVALFNEGITKSNSNVHTDIGIKIRRILSPEKVESPVKFEKVGRLTGGK